MTDLHIHPAPPDTHEPVAIVRDWDGEWREMPVSQLRLEQMIDDDFMAGLDDDGAV